MGKYDSSKTRVNPLMQYLKENDKIYDFLERILTKKDILFDYGTIENFELDVRYDCVGEKKYPPLKNRLIRLVENFNEKTVPNSNIKKLKGNREKLFLAQHQDHIFYEAIAIINKKYEEGKLSQKDRWAILEGNTQPDIFIETSNAYFVGEAKRTESGPETKTMWCNNRDQLIRHIEPLIHNNKRVFYFFIWEPKDTHYRNNDKKYLEYFKNYDNKINLINYLRTQLITETHDKVSELCNSFLGFLTWDEINQMYDNQINYIDEI